MITSLTRCVADEKLKKKKNLTPEVSYMKSMVWSSISYLVAAELFNPF